VILATVHNHHYTSSLIPSMRVNIFAGPNTVETLLTHTPRWKAKAMGYERLWVIRCSLGEILDLVDIRRYALWVSMGYQSFDCIL
jgi:hypothetical protein